MADQTTPTPPPSPWGQIGQSFASIAVAVLGSRFLQIIVVALLAVWLTVFLLRETLSLLLPHFHLPTPPAPPNKKWRAEDAIGRIQFGNVGCTATIIGPVVPGDDKIDILTAAHCVKVGGQGVMKLKDGREFRVKCVSRDPSADAAWLTAENPGGSIPYLELATELPQLGEVVWHQGYGVDKPGNRESGIYKGTTEKGIKCSFRLSVSPGDSGGGIVLDAEGHVLSPVCCTTKLAGMGTVFGAAPSQSAKIRPHFTHETAEPELIYPVLPMPDLAFPPPPPLTHPQVRRQPEPNS